MNAVILAMTTALFAAGAMAQQAATPVPATPAAQPGPAAATARLTAPPGAEVYFISPRDGEKLRSPVTVRFGLKGLGVAPAGIQFDNTGHHHLLVDTDLSEIALDASLPATAKILHFGKGQTETQLTLAPGKHTLELLFADYSHRSFDPPLHSKKITITVE
jgi:hypothetical protein